MIMIYLIINLIKYILFPSLVMSISNEWKSLTTISSIGLEYSPINEQDLLLIINTKSIISCTQQCHSIIECRIFDYNVESCRCRLFHGDIQTMGSMISLNNSRIGTKKQSSDQYINYGEMCSKCLGSRYLRCVNVSCQCPKYTYFDGSICQSQKLLGKTCNNSLECRNDLNYTCLARMQCGFGSMQTATIVAGNANGVSGNGFSSLYYPTGISMGDNNSLYIADFNNHRIMKYLEGSLNGIIVAGTGFSGSSLSQLDNPTGIYVDASYNIYIADSQNYRILFWPKDGSSGIKRAGTGSPGNGLNNFGVISGLIVDSQLNIYICDVYNHRIMKFMPNITNGIIVGGTTGSPGNSKTQLNTPYGVYFDDLNSYLYVADYNNHRIQRFHIGVSINGTTVAGGNGQGSANNQLNHPFSVCISKITNDIYVADSSNSRVQRWNSQLTFGVTIAGNGSSTSNMSTSIDGAMDIRINRNETALFVSETSRNRVWRFTLI